MKKLTDEKQAALLEAGIAAFARAGFRGASIGAIAGAAGTSVGVLYKYYENKEAFFDACLRHSLRSLEALLDQQGLEGLCGGRAGIPALARPRRQEILACLDRWRGLDLR